MTRRGWHSAATSPLAAAGALMCALPGAALATSLPQRTFPISPSPQSSTDAAISADGGSVAYIQGGSVYVSNVLTGENRLISVGAGGAPANGTSSAPAISAGGGVVAFASAASNLVVGGVAGDIYARAGDGALEEISAAAGGGAANGPSSQPAISADGRLVAFTSTATNLVRGAQGAGSQIFVRDRMTRTTTMVSVARGGAAANGPATTPAISADGSTISFASAATNLAGGGRSGVGGVFVRVPARDQTERVSVSRSGQSQNVGVAGRFTQISSLSRDGRLVVFDSNATNLVAGEDPRSRTNVFLRDRRLHTTTLISESNDGYEGNNDSFAPFITPGGLQVAFESFARNLAPGGGPRENVYVRDLGLRTTSVVNVAPDGARPGPELGAELLERPTLAGDGTIATFTTTAANLIGNSSGLPMTFLRLMTAPRGILHGPSTVRGRRPRPSVSADDPAATTFECRIDRRLPFACQPGQLRLPPLSAGTHGLVVRAGGPGMLYDPLGVRVTLSVSARG